MTEKIMENVWKEIKAAGNVDEEDKEIYLFGIYQGLIFLLNVVSDLFYTAKNFCRRISCKDTIQMLCDVNSHNCDSFVSDCVFAEEYGG